jgi:phosphate transport system permease protein
VTAISASGPRPAAQKTWRLTDRVGLGLAWALGLLFCAIAAGIVIYLLVEGIRYLRPSLLFTNPSVSLTSSNNTGGFLDPIIGTAIVSLLALGIAVPVGVAIAVWLSEYGRPTALARLAESVVEMLAGMSDIVLALWAVVVFEAPALGLLSQTTGHGVVYGKSFFAAGITLSLIALPLVVTTVREGLQAIPAHVREASYAVGKTKIATTRRVLLPAVRPSVVTGSMLGLGRVIGDTAVIVLVLGAELNIQAGPGPAPLSILRGTGGTLTSYIFQNAPTGDLNQPSKAYAAAFVLLIIVLALNVSVDVYSRRAKELRWS